MFHVNQHMRQHMRFRYSTLVRSECSGEPAQMGRLARAFFAAHIHKSLDEDKDLDQILDL